MALRLLGTADFAGLPEEVAHARVLVRKLLGEEHPVVDDVELLSDEVIANAVLHTRSGRRDRLGRALGKVTLTLFTAKHVVRVEVVDEGSEESRPERVPDVFSEHGRGLWIVDSLAARYGFDQQSSSTTFWFEVDY
jgi:anti-sigma regulatory factor (Ser/Thr protein kinase)